MVSVRVSNWNFQLTSILVPVIRFPLIDSVLHSPDDEFKEDSEEESEDEKPKKAPKEKVNRSGRTARSAAVKKKPTYVDTFDESDEEWIDDDSESEDERAVKKPKGKGKKKRSDSDDSDWEMEYKGEWQDRGILWGQSFKKHSPNNR